MFLKTLAAVGCLIPVCLSASQMPELDFNPPPRVIKMNHKNAITLTSSNFEIVVPEDADLSLLFPYKN